MRDFLQSFEQKSWQYACESYARAIKTIEICKRLNSQKHLEYWEKRLKELEAKYPQLKKQIGAF